MYRLGGETFFNGVGGFVATHTSHLLTLAASMYSFGTIDAILGEMAEVSVKPSLRYLRPEGQR